MSAQVDELQPWLDRWGLEPDGGAFQTTYTRSLLMPVRQGGRRAMLKIANERTEIEGAAVMAWWDGAGAAPVLAFEPPALLLVRAESDADLAAMARDGSDDAATEIICAAVAGLHTPRQRPPPATLETPDTWFRALRTAAATGEAFARAAAMLEALLAEPRPQTVLHGDIHHGNVLDFGDRGWLAIDPKGLMGERAYEYANVLKNPGLEIALRPGRVHRQLALIARLADLDPDRLRRWTVVNAALSAAWCIEDNVHVAASLTMLDYMLAELAG